MNELRGLSLRGLQLNTVENYNSIPGLMQQNDGRQRVNVIGGRVASWGDMSSQGNTFARNANRPYYEKNIWVSSPESSLYLTSPRRDYNFLHNGAKFGVYSIAKYTWSLAAPAGLFGVLAFSGASGTGLQFTISSQQSSGRFGVILRGGATSQSRMVTNLLNPDVPANYTPSDTVITQSVVNFGQTNGVRIQFGNAVANLAPFFPTLAEYPQGSNTIFNAVSGVANLTVRAGLILIYNWSDYTDIQVQAFDARVRNLLNQEKIIFQQLDI